MGWIKLAFKVWRIGSDIALGAAATCAVTSCLHSAEAATMPPRAPQPAISQSAPATVRKHRAPVHHRPVHHCTGN
jgi:hypothetical protein